MNQNFVEQIKKCFQNPDEAQKMDQLLEKEAVYDFNDLELLVPDDLYNKGIDNTKIHQFFTLCKTGISDEFYTRLQEIFTNPDHLNSVIEYLQKEKIFTEQAFQELDERARGMPAVFYRKIKNCCQQNRSDIQLFQQNQQNQQQPVGIFLSSENIQLFQQNQQNQQQPVGTFLGSENGLQIYQYSSQEFDNNDAKIILTVGETGSGKTRLLNFMANYLQDVQFNDNFRYRIIIENFGKCQAKSQTSEVKKYYIRGVNGKPDVIVVDTPGFCDTQGQDKEIVQQLGSFFQKLKDIHLVGFVLKASDNKLTVKQQYIFSSILQIFSKDIAENIVSFMTFSDSQNPGALVALRAKDSPFCQFIDQMNEPWNFQFNNIALYADRRESLMQEYWKIGIRSLDILFQKKVSSIPRKQLVQTGKVISERKTLEYMVVGLQKQLDQLIQFIDSLKDADKQIEMQQNNIKDNKNFLIEMRVPAIKEEPIDEKQVTTNCKICQFTCHYVCDLGKKDSKECCDAIVNQYCKICPGKCHFTQHQHDPFRYVPIMVDKIIKNDQQIGTHKSAIQRYNNLKSENHKNLLETHKKVMELQVTIVECMNKLESIALIQPESKSQIQYIELMLINEENNKSDGTYQMDKLRNQEDSIFMLMLSTKCKLLKLVDSYYNKQSILGSYYKLPQQLATVDVANIQLGQVQHAGGFVLQEPLKHARQQPAEFIHLSQYTLQSIIYILFTFAIRSSIRNILLNHLTLITQGRIYPSSANLTSTTFV